MSDDVTPMRAFGILHAASGPRSKAMLEAIDAWGEMCRAEGERAATERIANRIMAEIDSRDPLGAGRAALLDMWHLIVGGEHKEATHE